MSGGISTGGVLLGREPGGAGLSREALSQVLSLVFGVPIALAAPCVFAIDCDSLDTTPLEVALLYDDEALTLTLGADGDLNEIAEADWQPGARFLFTFSADDRARTGVYALASLGGPSTPASWRRAADFDASEDLVPGYTVAVRADGGVSVLRRLEAPEDAVLDVTDLAFATLTAATV